VLFDIAQSEKWRTLIKNALLKGIFDVFPPPVEDE
jgi:hypothetical protein